VGVGYRKYPQDVIAVTIGGDLFHGTALLTSPFSSETAVETSAEFRRWRQLE
jgi:hypothetical protein